MDDDSSWDIQDAPTSTPSSTKNTPTPKTEEPLEEPWDDEEPEQTEKKPTKAVKRQLEESNWLQQQQNEKETKEPPRKQETSFNQNTSFLQGADLIVGEEKELTPNQLNTTWLHQSDDHKKNEEKPKTRGNRDSNRTEEEQEPRRGNRPRTDQGNQDAGQRRFRNEEDNREAPKRGNRGNREGQESFQRGNREGQQSFQRGNREGQEPFQRGNRGFRESEEDNGFPKRGNRDTGGNFRKKEGFQTSEGSQYQRGGYRGRGRGRGGGGYRGGDYNNNYRGNNNNRTQQYREKTDSQYDRGERPVQERYQRPNYNYFNNQRPPPPRSFDPPVQEPPAFSPPSQIVSVKNDYGSHISETQKMAPRGRKCWPESSLHILNCRFVLTVRQLSDFRCKMLVIPYSTLQMEYFPGNLINSSSVDYRKKIMNKGSEIEAPGAIYLQKAIEVYTFEALCFVKIDKESVQESLKKGIHEMLKLVQKIEKPITLESLVFPICQELGDPSWVISPFMSHLENCRKVKEVWITTIQGPCYVKAASAFNSCLDKMFKGNEIFLNV